jgi:AraC-like DNA-binding protein
MSQKNIIFASELFEIISQKPFTTMEKINNGHYIQREITPLSDKDCFYVVDRHKTDFTYPLHCHGEYELNFIAHGKGLRRIVGDSVETTGEYDLVLIATPDLEHVWEQGDCTSEDIREITIQFSPHFFDSLIDTNQFARVKAMLEKARNGLCFPVTAIMKVYSLIDTLPETKGFCAVTQFLTMLYELSFFTDSAHALSTSSFAKVNLQANSRRVQKVQQYINEHYQEEIHLGKLSDLVGMTPTAFSRFFRQRTGRRLSDYVIDIRLGHASRMLIDTTMSVAEICYDCGFNNLSNFNRIFKRKKNCSPTEFREMYFKKKVII